MDELAGLRRNYDRDHLDEDAVADTWLEQLRAWFAAALDDDSVAETNAVQLATADTSGRPSVRTVLIKAIEADGVTFYTNYDSAKAADLEANPQASAVFAWVGMQRQVRLTGAVRRVDRTVTEEYFASRPRGSQLGAWASPQSSVVGGRAALDESLRSVTERFGDGPVPPPPFWGGYLLAPDEVEFWQGRPDRLHDRIRFRLEGSSWVRERLAP